jgi:hypothetical protein
MSSLHFQVEVRLSLDLAWVCFLICNKRCVFGVKLIDGRKLCDTIVDFRSWFHQNPASAGITIEPHSG